MADGFYLNLFPIGFLFQLFCCLRFLSPMLVFFRATLLFCQCWHAIIYHGVTAMTHFRAFEHGSASPLSFYIRYPFYSKKDPTFSKNFWAGCSAKIVSLHRVWNSYFQVRKKVETELEKPLIFLELPKGTTDF